MSERWLNIYGKTIIRKAEAFGQARVGLIVQPNIVCHMDEIGELGPYSSRKRDGIVYQLM